MPSPARCFRLASGLRGSTIELHIEDFAAQVDEMQIEDEKPGQGPPTQDWFSTHPFSPLRVKALSHYAESELSREDGISVEELEARTQTLMALMEPSYLEGQDPIAETMRRLLFAGAIAIAAASNGVSDVEIEAFEKFFGEGSFREGLDVDAIAADLDARIRDAREQVPHPRRVQVLHDLCVIARADGHVDDDELRLLRQIAKDLHVAQSLIDQSIAGPLDLD